MSSNSSSWSAPIQYGRWVLNTIFHQGLAVVMMYSTWVAIDYRPFIPDLLVAHIILCTIGLIPLMAEALILFSGDNVWSQDLEKKPRFWLHGILITVGTSLIIAGVAVGVGRTKQSFEPGHFESGHAVTGLVALIFICLSLLMGLMAAFSKQLSGYIRPVILKFAHNLIGIIGYILGIVALCLGYYTPIFENLTTSTSRNTATIAVAILCLWSLIRSFISAGKQIRSIANVYSKKGLPIESIGVNRPRSFILLDQQVIEAPTEEKENL